MLDLRVFAELFQREMEPRLHRAEVLTLRFVDDLSLAEVAEALGIPLGTVKSRLHLALKELREDPQIKHLFEP